MKRLAIFAHFDAQDQVKPYVLFLLEQLRLEVSTIHFVSTAALSTEELAKLRPYCSETLLKSNEGYDFSMWQLAMQRVSLAEYDEVVLVNSSIFGPMRPLSEAFARMAASPSDFWGMTDNFEFAWHVQSYFLVFRRRVLDAPCFEHFWSGVLPYRDKNQTIRSYEVGLSTFLVENGFSGEALVPFRSLARPHVRRPTWKRFNPTCYFPTELLARGMPFVKSEVLRDNPYRIPLGRLRNAMAKTGYDLSLIEFDRPEKRRWFVRP